MLHDYERRALVARLRGVTGGPRPSASQIGPARGSCTEPYEVRTGGDSTRSFPSSKQTSDPLTLACGIGKFDRHARTLIPHYKDAKVLAHKANFPAELKSLRAHAFKVE